MIRRGALRASPRSALLAAVTWPRAGSGAAPLPPLGAYSGEQPSVGITMAARNSFATGSDASGNAVVSGLLFPTGAVPWTAAGDYAFFISHRTDDVFLNSGTQLRSLLTQGTTATGSGSTAGGRFAINGANDARTLEINRTSASNPGRNWWPGSQPSFVFEDDTLYHIAFIQRGNTPVLAILKDGDGSPTVFTGSDNRSGTDNFHFDGAGTARTAVNFWAAIGGYITGTPTAANGCGGGFADVAMVHGSISNADFLAIANGTTSFASVPGIRYWNRLALDAGSGTFLPTVDVASAGAITRTARNSAALPSDPCPPLRTASPIKLTREAPHAQWALMPGQTQGRVGFFGTCSVSGYPIFARLRRVSDGTALVDWTQIVASHAGGAFEGWLPNVPAGVEFYREIWIGPPTSTIGGSDGYLVRDGQAMSVGVNLVAITQSQGNYMLIPLGGFDVNGSTGSGAGGVRAPLAGRKVKLRAGIQRGAYALPGLTSFSRRDTPVGVTGQIGATMTTIAGVLGDGIIAWANVIAGALSCDTDFQWMGRSGHSLDAFVFDRTTWTQAMAGSGTSWSATCIPQPGNGITPIASSSGVTGLEPGSISIAWSGGTLTDAANAGLTGTAINSSTPQTVTATGISATINYGTGVISVTTTASQGTPPAVTFTTRYDTGEGNTNIEGTAPDKMTLWGNTDTNGYAKRLFAKYRRLGISAVLVHQATANISQFAASDNTTRAAARDNYLGKLALGRDRIWSEVSTNPPFILVPYARGTTGAGTSKANCRWAQHDIGVTRAPYSAAASTQASSGATRTAVGATTGAWLWPGGFACDMTLEDNFGEHNDSNPNRGGTIVGAVAGEAVAGLMLGDFNRSRGPEATGLRLKPGDPTVLQVQWQFFGATATRLLCQTGGDTANLTDFIVTIAGSPATVTAALAADGQTVEITRAGNASWTGAGAVTVEWKSGVPYSTVVETSPTKAQAEARRSADETNMNTNLYDNKGGFLGLRPGCEAVPIWPPLTLTV